MKTKQNKNLDIDLLKRLLAGEPSKFAQWHSLKPRADRYKHQSLKQMLDQIPEESVVGMLDGIHESNYIAHCCRWYLRAGDVCPEATLEQLVDFATHRTNVAHDVSVARAERERKRAERVTA